MQQPARAVGEVASASEHQDGNKLGVSAGMIFGLKKAVFNSVDYATIGISTYAATPS